MREEQKRFFSIMMEFRRLNLSSMLPGLSHGDHVLLQKIYWLQRGCEGCCEADCLQTRQTAEAERGVRVSQLVRSMELPPPAVSRGLRILDNKGYVVRTVDVRDRRNTFVSLTESGRAVLREANDIIDGFSEAVFANMGDEVMGRLNEYLRQLVDVSKEEIERRKYEKQR